MENKLPMIQRRPSSCFYYSVNLLWDYGVLPVAVTVVSIGPAGSGWHWCGPDSPCSCCEMFLPGWRAPSHLHPPGNSCIQIHNFNSDIQYEKIYLLTHNVKNTLTQAHPAFQQPCPLRSVVVATSSDCIPYGSQMLCTYKKESKSLWTKRAVVCEW